MPHDRQRRASNSAFDSSSPLDDLVEGGRGAARPRARAATVAGRVGVVPGVELVEAWRARAWAAARSAKPRSQASMWRAAFLPWPTPTVTVRSAGTMSPPAKIPGWPVIMFGPTCDDAVLDLDARRRRRAARGRPPGRARARASRPRAPRARRSAAGSRVSSSSILSSTSLPSVGVLDRRQPLHHHALLLAPPRPRSRGRASGRGCAGRRRSPRSAPRRLAVRAASIAVLPPP